MTPVATASAPGKVILFGEHAVVYGRPAIAAPVTDVRATAEVFPNPDGGLRLIAPALGLDLLLPRSRAQPPARGAAPLPLDPLTVVTRATLEFLNHSSPDLVLRVTSTIPIASGLGSGAAISTAIVRALAAWFDAPLSNDEVSRLVFESEKVYHGTPSGIDNTVIAFGLPVYFVKGETLQPLNVPVPFPLLIGDTGIASPTKVAVAEVRGAWEADRPRYEGLFDHAGEIAREARAAIENGGPRLLGPLMDRNQAVLKEMGVSSPELDALIEAARKGGALGAKLSGGGRGGNMIALVEDERAESVAAALEQAGASRVLRTRIGN